MTNRAGGSSGGSGSEREALRAIVQRWEREAYDLDTMADRTNNEYTPLERRMLKQHANVKRGCANELRLELNRVRRGG